MVQKISFYIGRVGKTSLLSKYVTNNFDENQEMTINSCYLEKEIEYNDIKFINCIWVIYYKFIYYLRIQLVKKNLMP